MVYMVNMQKTPEEKREQIQKYSPTSVAIQPDYPYGLCIHLCNDELSKLNLDPKNLTVGDILEFTAKAKIITVHESASLMGDSCCNVDIQITDMSPLEEETSEEESDPEYRLYDSF